MSSLCDKCKNLWTMMPCMDSPYGEYGCLKIDCALNPFEEVTHCEHFDSSEQPSETEAE